MMSIYQACAKHETGLMQEARLREGAAYAYLPLEAVLVAGVDRLNWLHNLTTAPFASLAPAKSIEALILDPAGYILHACAAADDGERTWLLTDQGRSADLAAYLKKMRFMMHVEIEQVPVRAVGVLRAGDALPSEARENASFIWEDPWPYVQAGGAHYGLSTDRHRARKTHRTLLVVEENCQKRISGIVKALEEQGIIHVDLQAWEAARITDCRPRPNAESAPSLKALPHELDWLRTAVALNKGCFPGQESVAKIVNMGKPPRRITFLYMEGPEGDIPPAGSLLTNNGTNVGVVTSVARDYELGPVALALVKRSVPLEAVLEVVSDDAPGFVASQEMIVSPSGRSSASPQEIPGAKLRKSRAAMNADQKPRPRA